MTMLELKQQVSRLSERERRELHAYLIRLRHEKPEWRRMKAMDQGKKLTAAQLQQRLTRG